MGEGKLCRAIRMRSLLNLAIYIAFLALCVYVFITDWIRHGAGAEDTVIHKYTFLYVDTVTPLMGGLFFGAFVLPASFLFVRALIPCMAITRHKSIRKLGFGKESRRLLAVVEGQRENAGKEMTVRLGLKTIRLAKNWLILEIPRRVALYLADDFLWAYKHKIRTRMLVFGKIQSDALLDIQTRKGLIRIAGRDKQVDAALKGCFAPIPGS